MSFGYNLPEMTTHIKKAFFPGCLIKIHGADHLRDMLIRMHIFQGITVFFHRIIQLFIVKHPCRLEVFRFLCNLIKLCHRSRHSSEFPRDIHGPHLFPLLPRKPRKTCINPVTQRRKDLQRHIRFGQKITVFQPSHNFVQRIVRRPDFRIFRILFKQVELFFVICA